MSTSTPQDGPSVEWPGAASAAKIAAVIGKRAAKLSDAAHYASADVKLFAEGSRHPELSAITEPGSYLDGLREDLRIQWLRFMNAYQPVHYWWVADTPPRFDHFATSVVDAIMRAAFSTLRSLDEVGVLETRARCRWAALNDRPVDWYQVEPALWCEVAMMSRRRQPGATDKKLWRIANGCSDALLGGRGLTRPPLCHEKTLELPSRWRDMSQADRVAAIDQMWESRPQHLRRSASEVLQDQSSVRRTRNSPEPRIHCAAELRELIGRLRANAVPWKGVSKEAKSKLGVSMKSGAIRVWWARNQSSALDCEHGSER